MPMNLSKMKKMLRRKQDALKPSGGGGGPGGRSSRRDSDSSSRPSRLTRSKGDRNVLPGRPAARRERANATVDINRPAKVSKPKESVKQDPGNTLISDGDSVHDFVSQRTLFATETPNGKREYLPRESEANALELSTGKYIPDEQVEGPSIAKGLLDIDENKQKMHLRYDFTYQRNLFAVRTQDGRDVYLPAKSQATAEELKRGLYVEDSEISKKIDLGPAVALTNENPRFDLFKGREEYAVRDKDGKTIYLPRESEASELEKARGLYIDDDIVDEHESKRRRTALKDDSAALELRRAQRAAKLARGVTSKNIDRPPEPVTVASDGTPLWDGATPPKVSDKKQQETLKKLRPSYDLNKARMLYPTEVAKGKIKYLPLLEDATNIERIRGLYAVFVPPEPLSRFLENQAAQNGVTQQSFETDLGEVKAYTQAAIDSAFESAPSLVLRSAQLVRESAQQTPELQQQFTDVKGVTTSSI